MGNQFSHTELEYENGEGTFLLIASEIFDYLINHSPIFYDNFPDNYKVENIQTIKNGLNINFHNYDVFFIVYDSRQEQQVNFVQQFLFQIKKSNKDSIVISLALGESIEGMSIPNLYSLNFNYDKAQNLFSLLEFILINFFQKNYIFNIDIYSFLEVVTESLKEILFYEIQIEENKLNDIKKTIKTEVSKQRFKSIFLIVETHPDATYSDLSQITDLFKENIEEQQNFIKFVFGFIINYNLKKKFKLYVWQFK